VYFLPDIGRAMNSRTNRCEENKSLVASEREMHREILVGNHEDKKLLGRTRRRWEIILKHIRNNKTFSCDLL
jgi:hypothetical protein